MGSVAANTLMLPSMTNIAAIAEFDVLDEKGQKISRENWKIVYADSEETRSGNRTADKIYDLQESTFWQTVDNTVDYTA